MLSIFTNTGLDGWNKHTQSLSLDLSLSLPISRFFYLYISQEKLFMLLLLLSKLLLLTVVHGRRRVRPHDIICGTTSKLIFLQIYLRRPLI